MADQAVEERTRRRPGTGWWIAVRRLSPDGWSGSADGEIDLRDPSPAAAPQAPPASPPGARPSPRLATPSTVAPAAAPLDPDAAPEMDPRLRQRRLDVQVEHDRRRARLARVATALLVVGAAAYGALRSPLLAVKRPRVSGEVQTPAEAVLRAGGLTGQPLMIDLSLGSSARAIERLPWIATARVRRSWPDTVIVTVTERVPVAVIGGMFVDASGRVLSTAPGFAPLLAVRIDTGASAPAPPGPGGTVAPVYRAGVQVVTALPTALRPHVGVVFVRPDGTVRLSLTGGASAVLGDSTALPQKFAAVLTLIDQVRIGTGTIDVTVPSAPVLR